MKKSIVLLIAAAVMMIAAPLFANCGTCSERKEPDTVFQTMADVVNGRYQMKVEPYKKITVFQALADDIKDGSARAKKLSLRTPQEK